MIIDKNYRPPVPEPVVEEPSKITTIEEAYTANAMSEAYKAVRTILQSIRVNDNDPNSPPLFRTIKLDNGQLSRIKGSKHNDEYAVAFPAVFIHFINVYYNVGQSRIGEGKGVMRIHYVLNTLNNSDDEIELQGFEVYQKINSAIQAKKGDFTALVTRLQLKYWDQPLSFDDGLQPYWIDYEIWFNDYSAYAYKDYVDRFVVHPPFTNHSDQLPESNENQHEDHKDLQYDDVSGFGGPILTDRLGQVLLTSDDRKINIQY